MEIRKEEPDDVDSIRELNQEAFGQAQEAEIVDKLRENCSDLLSLVAVVENQVVGHILFSPALIEGEDRTLRGMALAPMAVLPDYQRQGIGSALVRDGITRLADTPCPFVIVLGHAEYYPRFGFEPAGRHGIRSEWDVPDEVFMILVLDTARVGGLSGTARYRSEFSDTL
ncbi:MAG: hypothetical protein AMJ46_00140 [Latescibacteria bacterium DG_63]|nr:MAG: hypothetical protein AMJ46_00140 [Latescibacteria bacterium DG_63]